MSGAQDMSISVAQLLARRVFAKRGNHSEAHLSELELAACIALGIRRAAAPEMAGLLDEATALMPLGTAKRAEWVSKALLVLEKALGGGWGMSHPKKYTSLAGRLLANSVLDPLTGCRVWTGKRAKRRGGGEDGRLNLRIDGRHVTRRAHRVSYQVFVGPIPDGYEIDHKCVNTLCIEPTHLEAVTGEENLKRRDQRQHEAANIRADSGSWAHA